MKGRPRLINVRSVNIGSPLFWTKSLKFPWLVTHTPNWEYLIVKLYGDGTQTQVAVSELREVVIEYQQDGLNQTTAGELKYLKVRSDQWQYAIEHLCEDVEFYGEHTQTGEVFAKIVPKEELPTPVYPAEVSELVELVEKRKLEVLSYMNEHFTKKEAERHSDNIYNLLMSRGDVAFLELQKIKNDDRLR